jgi:hypothetical protein
LLTAFAATSTLKRSACAVIATRLASAFCSEAVAVFSAAMKGAGSIW